MAATLVCELRDVFILSMMVQHTHHEAASHTIASLSLTVILTGTWLKLLYSINVTTISKISWHRKKYFFLALLYIQLQSTYTKIAYTWVSAPGFSPNLERTSEYLWHYNIFLIPDSLFLIFIFLNHLAYFQLVGRSLQSRILQYERGYFHGDNSLLPYEAVPCFSCNTMSRNLNLQWFYWWIV